MAGHELSNFICHEDTIESVKYPSLAVMASSQQSACNSLVVSYLSAPGDNYDHNSMDLILFLLVGPRGRWLGQLPGGARMWCTSIKLLVWHTEVIQVICPDQVNDTLNNGHSPDRINFMSDFIELRGRFQFTNVMLFNSQWRCQFIVQKLQIQSISSSTPSNRIPWVCNLKTDSFCNKSHQRNTKKVWIRILSILNPSHRVSYRRIGCTMEGVVLDQSGILSGEEQMESLIYQRVSQTVAGNLSVGGGGVDIRLADDNV